MTERYPHKKSPRVGVPKRKKEPSGDKARLHTTAKKIVDKIAPESSGIDLDDELVSKCPLAKDKVEEEEEPVEIVVAFWNIQGRGEFNSSTLGIYLQSIPAVDILILAEFYGHGSIKVSGWNSLAINISATKSLSRRNKSRTEWIYVLARDPIVLDNHAVSHVRGDLERGVARFRATKQGVSLTICSFHATYDENSGAAGLYMAALLNGAAEELLIGDANTYSGSKKGTRSSGRIAKEKNHTLRSGDLQTSRGGSPLDKVYTHNDFGGEVLAVGLLNDLVDKEAVASVGVRRARMKSTQAKMSGVSDHEGIYVRLSLGPGDGSKKMSEEGNDDNNAFGLLEALLGTGLEVVDIAKDGDCLFGSIAESLGSDADTVRAAVVHQLQIRNIIGIHDVNHLIASNEDLMIDLTSGDDVHAKMGDGEVMVVDTPADYHHIMGQPSVWGGVPELRAYSFVRNLVVVDEVGDAISAFDDGVETQVNNVADLPVNPIYLLNSGNHYSLLRAD